jgi:polyphosphate kinase
METIQELAWLRFNRRVLDQTRRSDFPVLERLRFLAIWSSNLDEFFAARIWRLFLQERGSDGYEEVLREVRAQADRPPGHTRSSSSTWDGSASAFSPSPS